MSLNWWITILTIWISWILWEQIPIGYAGEFSQVKILGTETGIYFDHIGTLYVYPSEWKVITYVELGPAKELWVNTKSQMIKLTNICKEIEKQNQTWYIYTGCQQTIPYLVSKRKIVDNLKEKKRMQVDLFYVHT